MKFGFLFRTIDWVLVVVPIILLCFGISVIFSLSTGSGLNLSLDQAISAIIGIIVATTLTFIDYRTWRSMSWLLYGLGIISLIVVLLIGSSTFGATRWIDFGFFNFQPSELVKFFLVIALARYLADHKNIGLKELIVLFFIIVIPAGLIVVEPDLGSASVVLFVSLVLLLFARIPKKAIIVSLVLMLISIPIGYRFAKPYQRDRIKTFLEPNADSSGKGYNALQSKIAIGSGGVFGRGLGEGSQSQLNFLPVAHTDFIFAGVAEATGFIGATVLLGLVGLIIVRAVLIAKYSQDLFGMYVSLGVASLFLYQTFVNAGGNLGLLPITGIPFPLVSFGGTATIVEMAGLGLLQSIYLRHKKIRFS